MWEVATGYCIRTYNGHSEWVRSISMHYEGQYFASASNDETVAVWALDTNTPMAILQGHEHVVECVAFANENASKVLSETFEGDQNRAKPPLYLSSGSRDKKILIWEVWGAVQLLKISGHDNWIRDLAFHPSGEYLYSSSDDKTIRVWELNSGRCKKKLMDAHGHFVTCLALNPRFPILASGSVDKVVKLWECR